MLAGLYLANKSQLSLKVLFGVEDGFGCTLSELKIGIRSHHGAKKMLNGFIKVGS